jgi:glycogen(starch) synthase
VSGGVMARLFSRPVRVLCVGNMYPPHDLRGGYELTWRSSVLYLRARGDAVRVLTTEYRSPDLDAAEELDADVHRELRWYWRDHAFPRHRLRERLAIERHNAAVLDRHLEELRPDVVAWWGMGGMSLALVERVRRAGIPAAGVVGDEWLRWGPKADGWLRPLRRVPGLPAVAERVTGLPARVDLDAAALWLFNSETVREKTRAGSGLTLPRSDVAHPGIDETLFEPREPEPWRWRLLCLGRLDPRKGVHLAVEALALLPEDATLVIQGSGGAGDYGRELRQRAEALDVAGRVTFSTAPREEIPGVYAAADALVFPVQWDEPWGLVPLEAMAVGRPVVATGTGGSAEYLRHERNCLVYEPRASAEALAQAVRRLASDGALRARLRSEGIATAARFTQTGYDEAIARALETAASRGRTV